jgi:hypothetical protein
MTYYLELLTARAKQIASARDIGMISAMCEARRPYPKLALLCDQELEEAESESELEDTTDAVA